MRGEDRKGRGKEEGRKGTGEEKRGKEERERERRGENNNQNNPEFHDKTFRKHADDFICTYKICTKCTVWRYIF